MAEYTELTGKPNHFFNWGSSCIDLIFWYKPDFVSEYEIVHSFFQNLPS